MTPCFFLQTAFKNGNYESCTSSLENMKSAQNVNRLALNANAALVDLARSGWTALEKYRETLGKLKEQVNLAYFCFVQLENGMENFLGKIRRLS